MSAPELLHFATMTATLADEQYVIPKGPMGTRIIAGVETMEITGERLNASMVGRAAADWVTMGPDGSYGTLDVRATLKTHDDALVYIEYSGRIDMKTMRIASAPLFQCGDERYDWLNRIQAIGDGTNSPDVLVYELYEVCLT